MLSPEPIPREQLLTGQVGYVIASGMKSTRSAQIGDTLHLHDTPVDPLPGFAVTKCNVFSGIYPMDSDDFELLQSVYLSLISAAKELSAYVGSGPSEAERCKCHDAKRK